MVDNVKFLKIAALTEIPENERLFLEINDLPIVIYSLNGEYYATGDVCTHDGGSIGEGQIEGNEVICPRHGARFDIKTGKVTRFPAVEDIPSYPVKIEDGYLYLGLPE
jgi:3-phenylpropionate/trans-cinnamate dioxygenase ferredoxin component